MSWELMLAETAEETGWGQHVLPGTNNLYNILADRNWKGSKKWFWAPEYDRMDKRWESKHEPFRVYASYVESVRDRVTFLRENPRYRAAGIFKNGAKGDLVSEANALQKAGYATDGRYAQKLISTFRGRTMQLAIREAQAREAAKSGQSGASRLSLSAASVR